MSRSLGTSNRPFTWCTASPPSITSGARLPMAAFQGLSDLLLAEIASFLCTGSIDSLASTSRWAVACPELAPSTRTLTRRLGAMKVHESDGAALGRLLSVRGGGSCKEVVVKDKWAMEALQLALADGRGTHLTSLVVDGDPETRSPVGATQLRQVLWLLPGLRRLQLLGNVDKWPPPQLVLDGYEVVWDALGFGACPCLEELRVGPAGSRWLDMSLDIEAVTSALREREALGITPLRDLYLAAAALEVPCGLQQLGWGLPARVVELRLSLTQPQMADLATCFKLPAGQPRWLRTLGVQGGVMEEPDASAMVTALAESGLFRSLQVFQLMRVQLKPAALDALSASLSPARRSAAPLLETLWLLDIVLHNQEAKASYTGFVAAALSSCPRLTELCASRTLWESVGFDEKLALRYVAPPASLPPLSSLATAWPLALQWVLEAPPSQLFSLQHLDIGPLGQESVQPVVTSLAHALPAMPNLSTLALRAHADRSDECCIRILANTLEAGAARELRSLHLQWTVRGHAIMLRALAAGTFPKLRELSLKRVLSRDKRQELSTDGEWALACLLKGRRGRHASLAVLDVEEAFVLTDPGLQSMSQALTEPTGARLESLSLSCQPALLPTGPRRLPMVDKLITVLEQPRTGSRLAKLRLHVFSTTGWGSWLRRRDLTPLVDHMQHALSAGAWPCMPASEGPVLLYDEKMAGRISLQKARSLYKVEQAAAVPQPSGGDDRAGPGTANPDGLPPAAGARPLTSRDLAALLLPPAMMLAAAWCRLRALRAADSSG